MAVPLWLSSAQLPQFRADISPQPSVGVGLGIEASWHNLRLLSNKQKPAFLFHRPSHHWDPQLQGEAAIVQ